MIYLLIDAPESRQDELLGELALSPTIGITESGLTGDLIRFSVFFASRTDAENWSEQLKSFEPQLREEEDEDWARTWRETWRPFPVGDRFYLVPEWMDDPAPEGRIRLEMHSGLAFGTGDHATTQMCLLALEQSMAAGARVLDIGTGSGILLAAAAKLGAGFVAGTDNDPEALVVARERLAREQIRERLVVSERLCFATGCADFLLMNIGAQVVIDLLPEVALVLAPGGRAVLTGILTTQAEDVRQAAVAQGLEIAGEMTQGEWAAWVVERPAHPKL